MSLSSRTGIRHKSSSFINTSSANNTPAGSSNPPLQNLLSFTSPVAEDETAYSQSEVGSLGSQPSATPPSQTTGSVANTVESLVTLTQKRITTLVYLKKVHEGKVHWFNTIHLSCTELERWFDHRRMIGRTTRFTVLGMSLSSLLDITNLQDFLKGMISLLQDYESIVDDDNFKPRMSNLSRGIFKQASKGPRKSYNGTTDYSTVLQESGEASLLYTPTIPFELDYFEVWITLSDILVEVYQKIMAALSACGPISGGSPNSSINTTSFGNISAPLSQSRPASMISFSGTVPASLSNTSLELIQKVDSKLKKLIAVLTKEIDGMARTAIREELTQLDPMLAGSFGTPILNPSGDWD